MSTSPTTVGAEDPLADKPLPTTENPPPTEEDPRRANLRTLQAQLHAVFEAKGPDWGDQCHALAAQIISLSEELGDDLPFPQARSNHEKALKARAALHMRPLTAQDSAEDGEFTCAICYDDGLVLGEMVAALPCKHWFHRDCIDSSLASNRTCPVCRREV